MLEVAVNNFFKMREGLVYRKRGDDLLFDVSRGMETHVINKNYDQMGHLGVEKVTETIFRSYGFPQVKEKVKPHVGNCLMRSIFSIVRES